MGRKAAEAQAAKEAEQRAKEEEWEEKKSRLSDAMEEYVYGVVAMLSLHGNEQRKVSLEGVEALRLVSRADKGCNTIAEFGGTMVMMKIAHNSNKNRIQK